ncbi:MAG: pyroglutamyl-peptidase I [Acutalibacter sp.]
MEQKTLLITGFEPFQQGTINPSWEAVALLPETIGPWRLEKLRLPVVFGKAADLAIARAQQLCPQAILAVGQAGGRGAVTPELVAINTRDAAIPDNEGNAFQGQPVVPGGGDGYFATALCARWSRRRPPGVSCKLSYTAGAYVCNDLFYRLLHQYRGTGVLVDFIHVPFLPEQAKNGEPSMPWRTWPGLWRHLSWPWSRKPRPFDRMHLLSPPQM